MFNLKRKDFDLAIENISLAEENIRTLVHNINTLTPEYTPDISILERCVWNPVFVPDECMLNHHKHTFMEHGASGFRPFYEDCYTSEKFTYLEKNLGKLSQGLLFPTINDPELPMWMNKSFRVKGELYCLSGKQIISLDNYKKNGVLFDRIKININIPYYPKSRTRTQSYNGVWSSTYNAGKTRINSIMAYVYVARMEYWHDQLEKLDNFNTVFVANEPDKVFIRRYYDYKFQGNQ